MGRSGDAYHHGDLRNALISAALRLIAQGGEAAFSLRQAARDVGVSPNAAYRHFEHKSELLTAVAAAGLQQLTHCMLKAMARAADRGGIERPSVARFKAVGRAYVEFAIAHPELHRIMFSKSGVARVAAGAASMVTPTPRELLGLSLDALVADGLLPPDRRDGAELTAWAVVHGFASLLELAGDPIIPTGRQRYAALESLLDFTARGMCAPALPPRQSAPLPAQARRRPSRGRGTPDD